MDPRFRRGFRVGVFSVEPLAGRIAGPDGAQHVQPKVMDVLVLLAQHAGQLVERDTLLEQVWRRITSEEVLTRCISELRRALSDDRGSPSYIQTVPKRGYRLVADVVLPAEAAAPGGPAEARAAPSAQTSVPQAGDAPQASVPQAGSAPQAQAGSAPQASGASQASSPPTPSSAAASVAVLPFDNHSTDPAHAFMGDAFAAELHGTLGRVDRLRVASRRSSFLFKDSSADLREIGARLNVQYIISGSLRCNGPHLHVIAELNDATNATQIWAQRYDRKSEDLLAVEKEIAEAIVGSFTTQQLRADIVRFRQKSTSSLDAWGLVQKARSFVLEYTKEGLLQAIEPLERAIELDPDYPAAHAMLGSLLVERLVNGLSSDGQADESHALDAVTKALALAPEDPFILKIVSLVWSYAGEQRKAINCLRKAVSYAPFDFGAWGYMGWPLTATGEAQDLRELRGILERLLAMEPHHPGAAFWLYHQSVAHACEGSYRDAAESAEAAVELRPRLALAWMHYANVLGHCGREADARDALEQCAKANPALTPQHFAWLVTKMSGDRGPLEQRLGGLRKIGALEAAARRAGGARRQRSERPSSR